MGLGEGEINIQKVYPCMYSSTFLGNNHYFCIRVDEMKRITKQIGKCRKGTEAPASKFRIQVTQYSL